MASSGACLLIWGLGVIPTARSYDSWRGIELNRYRGNARP
jgi:hypothetical protein